MEVAQPASGYLKAISKGVSNMNIWAVQLPKETYYSLLTKHTPGQPRLCPGSFICIPKIRWDEFETLSIFKYVLLPSSLCSR